MYRVEEAAVYADPCSILLWGNSNMDADPYFEPFEPNGDRDLWDFHLKSMAGCWDAGSYRVDFNKDGIVNLLDFAKLANL